MTIEDVASLVINLLCSGVAAVVSAWAFVARSKDRRLVRQLVREQAMVS
jgi:hypothetical protein